MLDLVNVQCALSDIMTSFIFQFSALHALNEHGSCVVQLFISSDTFWLVI